MAPVDPLATTPLSSCVCRFRNGLKTQSLDEVWESPTYNYNKPIYSTFISYKRGNLTDLQCAGYIFLPDSINRDLLVECSTKMETRSLLATSGRLPCPNTTFYPKCNYSLGSLHTSPWPILLIYTSLKPLSQWHTSSNSLVFLIRQSLCATANVLDPLWI